MIRVRYFIQAMVMLGDLMVAAALLYLLYHTPLIGVILAIPTICALNRSGGILMAWKPTNIRDFLNNSRKVGL